jgi:hypothetical protein
LQFFLLQWERLGQLTLLQDAHAQLPSGMSELGGVSLGMLHVFLLHLVRKGQFMLPQCRQVQLSPEEGSPSSLLLFFFFSGAAASAGAVVSATLLGASVAI